MSFLGLFSDNQDKLMNTQGINRSKRRSGISYNNLLSNINDINAVSDKAYSEGDKTTQQRFGDMIDTQTNLANKQAANTKSNLARAQIASGGDFTGATSVGAAQADDRSNKSIREALNYYTRLNQNANERANRRGDELLLRNAGINQRQYGLENNNLKDYQLREIQRKQADRQTVGGLIGGALGAGASILCWVAEELYGKYSYKTAAIRWYMIVNLDKTTPIGLFARLYKRYGKSWASFIRTSGLARWITTKVFDRLFFKAIRQVRKKEKNK